MVDLRRLAEELNIDEIGVCDASRFTEVEKILLNDLSLGILPPFTETDIEKRVNPELTLKDARSFIVLLEHYVPDVYEKREGRYGNISPAACGIDYHKRVRDKLNALVDVLSEIIPNGIFMPFVDNSPFSEKHIAQRSGLGKILKNGLFYSEIAGSRCFIGIILSDQPFEAFCVERKDYGNDSRLNLCMQCSACLRHCPGKALTEKGLNSYRCVSYLTQKKEALSFEEEKMLGQQIYGCDVCQKVCPVNRAILPGFETGCEVNLDELLQMSNKNFKLTYQKTAAGWRGKKQLQRNADIILKNMEK